MGKGTKVILERNCSMREHKLKEFPVKSYRRQKKKIIYLFCIKSLTRKVQRMANKVRRNRRRQQVNLVTNIIFCLITLAALTGCIILLLQNYGLRNKSQEAMARLKEFEDKEEEY